MRGVCSRLSKLRPSQTVSKYCTHILTQPVAHSHPHPCTQSGDDCTLLNETLSEIGDGGSGDECGEPIDSYYKVESDEDAECTSVSDCNKIRSRYADERDVPFTAAVLDSTVIEDSERSGILNALELRIPCPCLTSYPHAIPVNTEVNPQQLRRQI